MHFVLGGEPCVLHTLSLGTSHAKKTPSELFGQPNIVIQPGSVCCVFLAVGFENATWGPAPLNPIPDPVSLKQE